MTGFGEIEPHVVGEAERQALGRLSRSQDYCRRGGALRWFAQPAAKSAGEEPERARDRLARGEGHVTEIAVGIEWGPVEDEAVSGVGIIVELGRCSMPRQRLLECAPVTCSRVLIEHAVMALHRRRDLGGEIDKVVDGRRHAPLRLQPRRRMEQHQPLKWGASGRPVT